jgi:uncharacterized protein YndB with AHSA1/START domain
VASIRAHAIVDASADEVWKAVGDPEAIVGWFPGVTSCRLEGDVRVVGVGPDLTVRERIVTNDPDLRRFQYSLQPDPVPVEHHLATVDVIDLGDRSLVVYGTDVLPDAAAAGMQGTLDAALAGLTALVAPGTAGKPNGG